jgi:DNA-binding MarR family transcriptional regulator
VLDAWLAPYLDRMEEMFRHLFHYFHGRLEAAGAPSPSQYFVLKQLEAVGSLSVSDLAQRLDMTTAGSTGLVDRLVRAGLVQRTRDENDRRVVWVALSEAGISKLAEARELRRSIMADICRSLTPPEIDQLLVLYEKMARHIPSPAPGTGCELRTKE